MSSGARMDCIITFMETFQCPSLFFRVGLHSNDSGSNVCHINLPKCVRLLKFNKIVAFE